MANKCPTCHSDNPDTLKFCGECGTQLPPPLDIRRALTETLRTPIRELSTGSSFAGRYQVIEELGHGGMGRVYKVFDTKINEKVALKLIKPEIAFDRESVERFSNELKLARKIRHKNVCAMFDLGDAEGAHFITMEYIHGEDLKSMIRMSSGLTTGTVLSVGKQICDGLAEAHSLGIVHRDLKPQNIMIDKGGNAKIMDFGIARSLKEKGITGASVMIGTPEYMSPEQAEAKEVDQRSDIYSLGVILYEMTTGQVPFTGETGLSIAMKHKGEIPLDPKQLNSRIPDDLGQVILKCLAKDKERRYQTATELRSDLEKIEKGIPTSELVLPEKRPSTSREITLQFKPRKIMIIFAAVAALAVITIGIWRLTTHEKANPAEAPAEAVSVLVADFENLTGEPIFEGTIEQTLSLGLAGSPVVKTFNRESMRRTALQLDPKSDGRLDSEMAQAVGRRMGINFVVAGKMEAESGGYAISVWTLRPDSTQRVHSFSVQIPQKASMLKETNKLAAQLVSSLSGVKSRYVKQLTTTSLEAMKAFSEAMKYEAQDRYEEAIQEYLRAIKEDEEFGLAYSNMANDYLNIGQAQKSKESYEKALAHIDRMTEAEKYTIRSSYYIVVRNYKKAIESLKLQPRNTWALANLPLAYFYAREIKNAIEAQKKVLEDSPKNILGHYNLSWYALADDDLKLAEESVRKVLDSQPSDTEAYVVKGLIKVLEGSVNEAKDAYHKMKDTGTQGPSLAEMSLADLGLYEGRLSETVDLLEKGIVDDEQKSLKDYAAEKWLMIGQAFLLQGKENEAISAIKRALSASRRESVKFSAAQLYIDGHQDHDAMPLLRELKEQIYPEYQSYALLLEGELKLRDGDSTGALRLFEEANSQLDTWLSRYALGRGYLKAGAYTEAHEAFEACLKRRGEATSVFFEDFPTCRYIPSVYYYLGRVQQAMRSVDARGSFEQYLSIKAKADEGIPEVEDAKKRLASLQN